MARRKPVRKQTTQESPAKRKYSLSQIVLYILSLIIVLSMTIGFVISVLPSKATDRSSATPTPVIFATITPTPTQELTETPAPTTGEPSTDGVATPASDQ